MLTLPKFDMSTLGMTQPTQSSAVQPTAAADLSVLDELLGDVVPRREKEILAANQAMSAVKEQAQNAPTFLERLLKSPAGLASILATVGGATAGGLPGALGAASGSMGGIGAQVSSEQAGFAAQLKQLQDAKTKAQEDLDKTRQRAATLFGQNPEAFTRVDPTTGQPAPIAPPSVIGYWILGTEMLPLDPTVKGAMERRGKEWDASIRLVGDALNKASSVEDARNLLRYGFRMMDFPNVPDAVIESLANSFGKPQYQTELARLYLMYAGSSGLKAMQYAAQNQLPLDHPDVMKMLNFYDPQKLLSASQRLEERYYALTQELATWANAHPAEDAQIRDESKADTRVYLTNLAQIVFAGEPDKLSDWERKMAQPGDELGAYYAAYRQASGDYDLASFLATQRGLDLSTITPDQVRTLKHTSALQLENAAREEANKSRAVREMTRINGLVRTQLQGLHLAPEQIDLIVFTARNEALKQSTDAQGNVDQVKYENALQQELAAAAEQLKQ